MFRIVHEERAEAISAHLEALRAAGYGVVRKKPTAELTVGAELRERRRSLGLSQRQCAALLGYRGAQSVCAIETGQNRLTLKRWAKIEAVLAKAEDSACDTKGETDGGQ